MENSFTLSIPAVTTTLAHEEEIKAFSEVSREEARVVVRTLKTGTNPGCKIVGKVFTGDPRVMAAIEDEIDYVKSGNSSTRFIKGEYGTGKTFNLKIIAARAFDNNMAVSHMFLNKDLAMQKMENIYQEFVKRLHTVDCSSFTEMIDKWIVRLTENAKTESISSNYKTLLIEKLRVLLKPLDETAGIFKIALSNYIQAKLSGDGEYLTHTIAWLSGDGNVAAAAKRRIGIKGEVDKINHFEFMRGMLKLVKIMGYSGTVILFDECEHMRQILLRKSRDSAYNSIRTIIDYTSENSFDSALYIFAGNSEWYTDPDRGIDSHPALSERITPKIRGKYVNSRNIIIELKNLSENEIDSLMKKICQLYKIAYGYDPLVKIEPAMPELKSFYKEAAGLMGGKVHPRNFVKNFVELVEILDQNPEIEGTNEIMNIFAEFDQSEMEEQIGERSPEEFF